MGDKTGISWTDKTFNRWWGCAHVTAGCDNCYAEALARRSGRIPEGYVKGSRRILSKSHNESLLRRWDREAKAEGRMYKVFAHSMSDVFDQEVPDEWRTEMFRWMAKTDNLWFQILTKRAATPARFLSGNPESEDFFRRRVWLGTSIASQQDLPMVRKIMEAPARLHWISYEPAIGPADMAELPDEIRWVVIGGESEWGGRCRPFDINWAYDSIETCHKRGIKVFVKQMGSRPYCSERISRSLGYALNLKDGHGADPSEWPADLRIQEFPL